VLKIAGFELGDFSETMKQRRLGKNGPMVAAIGLGCMGMPYAYGQRNDAESIAFVASPFSSATNGAGLSTEGGLVRTSY
jgi:hypothetical protein